MPIWIHKQSLCAKLGFSSTNLFELKDKSGNLVRYTWIEKEIANYHGRENFIKVNAGSLIECKCDLKEMYNLNENVTYRVRYDAYNPRLEQSQLGFELKSEVLSFTYRARKP